MSLWMCTGCGAAYSVGAACCPQCGADDHVEDYDMPKITLGAGATYEAAADSQGGEQPSATSTKADGGSSTTPSATPSKSASGGPAPSLSPAPGAQSPSAPPPPATPEPASSGTAPTTAGSTPATTSGQPDPEPAPGV